MLEMYRELRIFHILLIAYYELSEYSSLKIYLFMGWQLSDCGFFNTTYWQNPQSLSCQSNNKEAIGRYNVAINFSSFFFFFFLNLYSLSRCARSMNGFNDVAIVARARLSHWRNKLIEKKRNNRINAIARNGRSVERFLCSLLGWSAE